MTRETKIGLLVGLAFIIVIGILLSDHLTSATEPQQAPLVQAGESVRESVNVPGANQPPASPVALPPDVAPQQPVLTREELAYRQQQQLLQQQSPVSIVKIGGPAVLPQPSGTEPIDAQSPGLPTNGQGHQDVVQTIPPGQEISTEEVAGANPYVAPGESLVHIAQRMNEPLVKMDGSPVDNVLVTQPPFAPKPTTISGEYIAQPGDTLSRMAAKLMGANNAANRDAIIRANPSLKENPNKIIAGRKYMIPVPSGAADGGSQVAVTPTAPANTQRPSSQPEYWYTVKEGDSLWKIAQEQLGDGNAYAAIKELNKDVLKGGDIVTPNMKLRLPARPVASAE